MEGARRHRKDRHDIQELVHLHRLKLPTREAARDLGMTRSTLRRCHELLSEAGLLDDPLDELPSLEALAAAPQSAPRRRRPPPRRRTPSASPRPSPTAAPRRPSSSGCRVRTVTWTSATTRSSMCRRLPPDARPVPTDVAIRVEAPPGEVAQVHFGCVGHLTDPATGLPRDASVFLMVLGFSRHTPPDWSSTSRSPHGSATTCGPSMG